MINFRGKVWLSIAVFAIAFYVGLVYLMFG